MRDCPICDDGGFMHMGDVIAHLWEKHTNKEGHGVGRKCFCGKVFPFYGDFTSHLMHHLPQGEGMMAAIKSHYIDFMMGVDDAR